MKEYLKKIIPRKIWKQLRDIKKYARIRRKGSFKTGWLHIVATAAKIFIKENISVIEELDYSRLKIMMAVSSCAQLTRLNACRKEPETIAWLEKEVHKGDVVYDVGAHVGAYSLIAASRVDVSGKVYAFEPDTISYAALIKNIALNNYIGRITSFHTALSNVNDGFSGTYRLDDYQKWFSLLSPTHLKIDVDGSEWMILQGARETFAEKSVKSVLIEVDHSKTDSALLLDFFEKNKFRLVEKHPRGHKGEGSVFNYIFKR